MKERCFKRVVCEDRSKRAEGFDVERGLGGLRSDASKKVRFRLCTLRALMTQLTDEFSSLILDYSTY